MRLHLLRRALGAVSVLFLLSAAVRLQAQNSPCRTEPPLADAVVGSIRLQYSDPAIDSTAWKASGVPFATGDAIQLSTKRQVCNAAVTAYNAKTGANVASVFVALVGDTGYMVMSPPVEPGKVMVFYLFDKHWTFVQALAG